MSLNPGRRAITIGVFVAAALCFFLTYQLLNDQFDRLARARQIAVYGDVPFRDFFDPGYWLTIYVSALLQRAFGDSLLAEVVLNVACMATGTALVFVLASEASRSTWWGLLSAALVIAAQPRAYDYDKVLFFPLGLWACWRYVDRPTLGRLLSVAAATVLAGLFRYDSAMYLGAAALVSVIVRHGDDWRMAARRALGLGIAMVLLALPALLVVQHTSGLVDAFTQITTYARREGARTGLFHPPPFNVDLTAPLLDRHPALDAPKMFARWWWLPGFLNRTNAAACLYYLALGGPILAFALVVVRAPHRRRAAGAQALNCVVLSGLVTLFILRAPVEARIGAVMPLIVVSLGFLVGRWPEWGGVAQRWSLGAGLVAGALTLTSLAILIGVPPKANLHVVRRIQQFAATPPPAALWPGTPMEPLVNYLRACTMPEHRILAGWFFGELYVFAGRGFAAGLPVVFGEHWTEPEYQQRSLRLLASQTVPFVIMSPDTSLRAYTILWNFISTNYEPIPDAARDGISVEIWARRGLPIARRYGEGSLPCYAS